MPYCSPEQLADLERVVTALEAAAARSAKARKDRRRGGAVLAPVTEFLTTSVPFHTPLLAGAVDFARDQGAPAVEGYPVDNKGARVDLTMAYVGTRGLFEKAGFTKAADTSSVLAGFPRVLMRLSLD